MERQINWRQESLDDNEFREFLSTIAKPKFYLGREKELSYEEVIETAIDTLIGPDLLDTREKIKRLRAQGIAFNPRHASAVLLINEVGDISDKAISMRQENNLPMFILWKDIEYGFETAAVTLRLGDEQLRGSLAHIRSLVPGELQNPLKIRALEAGRILMEDEKGFELIEEVIKNLEGRDSEFTSDLQGTKIPEFASAGAKYAKKAYASIYEIAQEEFYSENS